MIRSLTTIKRDDAGDLQSRMADIWARPPRDSMRSQQEFYRDIVNMLAEKDGVEKVHDAQGDGRRAELVITQGHIIYFKRQKAIWLANMQCGTRTETGNQSFILTESALRFYSASAGNGAAACAIRWTNVVGMIEAKKAQGEEPPYILSFSCLALFGFAGTGKTSVVVEQGTVHLQQGAGERGRSETIEYQDSFVMVAPTKPLMTAHKASITNVRTAHEFASGTNRSNTHDFSESYTPDKALYYLSTFPCHTLSHADGRRSKENRAAQRGCNVVRHHVSKRRCVAFDWGHRTRASYGDTVLM